MATTDEAIGERVRALLAAHKLSQTELARRLGLDPSALSRALTGERRFRAREIALIADEFGVSTATLLEGEEARPRVAIAARRSEPNVEAAKQGIERMQFYLDLAKLIGSRHPVRDLGVAVPTAHTFQAGQELAERVLEALGGNKEPLPTDLHQLAAWVEGAFAIGVALEPLGAGLDGLSVLTHDVGLAIVSSTVAPARQRWTLAHELGHLLFKDVQDDLLIDDNVYRALPLETRANAFAAAFLMPADVVRERWGGKASVDEATVASMLDTFGVSLDALAFRLHNIGCVNAVGRDEIRALRPLVSLLRNQGNRQAEGFWMPTALTSDAVNAFAEGRLGVRWLAQLVQLDPEDLLRRLKPNEQESEALRAGDEMVAR